MLVPTNKETHNNMMTPVSNQLILRSKAVEMDVTVFMMLTLSRH